MSEIVKEMYLSEIHSAQRKEEQVGLGDFTEENDTEDEIGTAISVVTEPTGGISEVCDESVPSLGMPLEKLNLLRKRRAEIQENRDVTDTEAHNQAVAELDLEEIYRNHLKQEHISEKVDELAERVIEGETITLVCFEKHPKWCHRHILKEELENRVVSIA
jgi:hypothetical protein